MISCISCENAHLFGSVFHSQFQLRYRAFIERQDYDVQIYKGMEYDQYDTPASHYLVYHTPDGRALGVSRLTPTTQGCMLKDLWPNMVEDKELLDSAQVWEGTRYCIDKDVEPALRTTIIHEMAIAYLEFGLQAGPQKDRRHDADLYLPQRLRETRHLNGVSRARHRDRQAQDARRRHSGRPQPASQCPRKDGHLQKPS